MCYVVKMVRVNTTQFLHRPTMEGEASSTFKMYHHIETLLIYGENSHFTLWDAAGREISPLEETRQDKNGNDDDD